MEQISRYSMRQIRDRLCELLNCTMKRLDFIKRLKGNDDYEHLTTFWQILQPWSVMSRFMRSTTMDPGEMLILAGAIPHFGQGSPEGELRIIGFFTFGEPYDVDFQASSELSLTYDN